MFIIIEGGSPCQIAKWLGVARWRSSGMGVRQAAGSKLPPVHALTTVYWTFSRFVTSRRWHCSQLRASYKSFHRMASISPIGKLLGPRSTPRKRFRSTWMASRCSFRASDMKPYQERFALLFRRIVHYYRCNRKGFDDEDIP